MKSLKILEIGFFLEIIETPETPKDEIVEILIDEIVILIEEIAILTEKVEEMIEGRTIADPQSKLSKLCLM